MRCRNCGQVDRFVLLVELAVLVRMESDQSDSDGGAPNPNGGTPDPNGGVPDFERRLSNSIRDFSDPDWGFSLACDACASTDVAGNPAQLLAAYGG